jgi:hypothetical protein
MQTFDQALLHHYKIGNVAMEDALHVATSPHDFKLLVAGDGRTATSMDDLGDATRRSNGHSPSEAPRETATPPGLRPGSSLAPPGMAA